MSHTCDTGLEWFNDEEIIGTFFEKELQKIKQSQFQKVMIIHLIVE